MRTTTNFKKGDLVYSPYFGYGIVTKIMIDRCVYPIIVTWYGDKTYLENPSSFTEDGYMFSKATTNPNLKITVVERVRNYRKLLNRFKAFFEGE